MKIQDIAFVVTFLFLFLLRKPRFTAVVGLLFLFLSLPLFSKQIFFTAERLTWYAACLFLMTSLTYTVQQIRIKKR